MTRITVKDLKLSIKHMNELMGRPTEPYSKDENDKLVGNIGNFHLYQAYGGYNVHEMANHGGGVRTPLSYGTTTARDLYNRIHAFMNGYEEGKNHQ